LLLALPLLAAGLVSAPARAQAPERVRLSGLDAKQFPLVSATLDVRAANGDFLTGLKKEQITLLENGVSIPLDELKERTSPLELSVALDATASMTVYTPDGRTRYQVVADMLEQWAGQQSGGQGDHFNLFAGKATPSTDLSYRSDWLAAFRALPDPAGDARPALDSLTQAIQKVETTQADPGMARVVLWITSPPESPQVSALPDLVSRAQKAGVRLYIWSLSPAVAIQSVGGQALQQAAAQTGGQFVGYSGGGELPNPDDWFNPLRGMYTLRYTSRAHATGDQTLAVQIQQPDEALESTPLTFPIRLQPPNPILISPPAHLQRTCPAGCTDPAGQLTPGQIPLRLLVEFPDGHPRALTATRLFVDGKLAAERSASPFNTFTWDLSGLTTSGVHHIAVEAVDSLGLSKRSLELPVQVQITILKRTWLQSLLAVPGLGPAAAVIVGLLCLGIAAVTLRRRFPDWRTRLGALPLGWIGRLALHGRGERPADREEPNARRPGDPRVGLPAAQLIRLGEDERPGAGGPVRLPGREVTLGSDPTRAEILVEDPSVDGLHARLASQEDGRVRISDAGSVAGTWVNAEPVPAGGVLLEHGDLISAGRVLFRFETGAAPHPRHVMTEKTSEYL
jgi:hypothetical protein